MKGKKTFKRLTAVLLTAVMLLACAMPVSAASSYTKKATKTLTAGQCYHLLNKNISSNKITGYNYRIVPQTNNTRYDVVFAYGNRANAVTNCRKDSGLIKNTTYLKTSSSSNSGLIACIYVKSGSVKLQLTCTTTNSAAKLTLQKQSSSHKPLYSVSVTKGKGIKLWKTAGNISYLPVIFGGKSGTAVRRTLTSTSYEKYTFRSANMVFQTYRSKKLRSSRNLKYDSVNGSTKYVLMHLPVSKGSNYYSGLLKTTKGTATYLYPSDCLKIKAQVGTVK